MKKTIITRGLLITFCTLGLSGCGIVSKDKGADSETPAQVTESIQSDSGSKDHTNNSNDNIDNIDSTNHTDSTNIESLISSALGNGSVTEFTETECTLSPVIDNGESMMQAAPGYTPTEGNLTVHYQSGCEFQLAVSDISTGKTTFSPASVSDIKKQTHLLVFGEKGDSEEIEASKIIIWRTENAAGTRG